MTIREKIILDGEDRASAAFKKAGGNFDGMVGTMKKAAGALGLAFVGAQVVGVGVKALKMASDAEEAGAAFSTTFGPAVGRASAFVDEFANKAGFATYELEQMLAITGNVVQGIGATEDQSAQLAIQMATLAGDVASFSNAAGGAQAVMGALQSAINGEREALKTYGLALSEAEVQQKAFEQTGKSSADELTRLEKANATVALAYQKAGKAVGDLDRTQNSAANSMRRVSARMKEAGVQVGGVLLKAFEGLLPTIEAMIPTLADVAKSVAGFLAAAAPLAKTILTILNPAFKALTFYLDLVGDGMTSIASLMGDETATAALRLGEAQDYLAEQLEKGEDPLVALANGLAHLADNNALTAESYQQLADQSGIAEDGLLAVQDALLGDERYTKTRDRVEALNTAFGRAAPPAEEAHDSWMNTGKAAYYAGQNAAGALPAIHDLTLELLLAAEAGESVNDVMLAATDPLFAAVDAWRDYQDLLESVNEDGKQTTDETLDLWEAQLKLGSAMDGISGEAYERAMEAIMLSTGASRDEVELLLDSLGEFDGKTFTAHVKVTGMDEIFEDVGSRGTGGGSLNDPFKFHGGGKVPLPRGQETLALVSGQEQIATPDTFDAMVGLLADIRDRTTSSGGGANVTIPITVYAGAGADGATIARDIENELAQSQLIRRLPERL